MTFQLVMSTSLLQIMYLSRLPCSTKSNVIFFSLEIVGRFPDENECDDLQMSRICPIWLPIKTNQKISEQLQAYNRSLR